jgi:four helix bundle protein
LVLLVYQESGKFPEQEDYGLVTQFRRAAVSIAANIAEGYLRFGLADKVKFLNIAQGSLAEVRYYFILAEDLGYLHKLDSELLESLGKLLNAYISAIKSQIKT